MDHPWLPIFNGIDVNLAGILRYAGADPEGLVGARDGVWGGKIPLPPEMGLGAAPFR